MSIVDLDSYVMKNLVERRAIELQSIGGEAKTL